MSQNTYHILECNNPDCEFRFPVVVTGKIPRHCPKCGSMLFVAYKNFLSQKIPREPNPPQSPVLEVLLDNIRSIYNVGSMLRSGDGAGIKHFHLAGITATPEHFKIKKTGLGAESQAPWTYYPNALNAAKALKNRRLKLWALEGGEISESIFNLPDEFWFDEIALVIGNEVSGVDPEILPLCDHIIQIPMQGMKESLNVAIAFGIAIYHVRYYQQFKENCNHQNLLRS